MDFPVSEELRSQLGGQKMRVGSAPTETSHLMKWANDTLDAGDDIDDRSPSGGEEDRPKVKPGTLRVLRARPFLAVIEGGR